MKTILTIVVLILTTSLSFSQSIEDVLSQKKMRKDLALFKSIRETANSGLYTYRTPAQIDSIYQWAFEEIKQLKTHRDFHKLITYLTNYEGSLHNGTYWSTKRLKALKSEKEGYFPYPLKIIEDKVLLNSNKAEIPLGTEIISINSLPLEEIVRQLGKYYTTDGYNLTGKKVGINRHFSKYFRYYYGPSDNFEVRYKIPNSDQLQHTTLKSVGYKAYENNFKKRHSLKTDRLTYDKLKKGEDYYFQEVDAQTAILTINTFSLGSESTKSHLKYKNFLDSIFVQANQKDIQHLIVDIRHNGGGNPPNDMITLSYLASTPQKEIKAAWVSFVESIPHWKHIDLGIPFFLKPIAKSKLKKYLKQELPIIKDNRRYYKDAKEYPPNDNAFKGQVYLLVSPYVASASSLFAASVASNTNAIIIGEETSGGYYEHNGAFSVEYVLPKSKITTLFSVVNLTQDVVEKENQVKGRGVMPTHKVEQSFEDFIENKDTQLNFTLDLISK